jgi:hypothetical protein
MQQVEAWEEHVIVGLSALIHRILNSFGQIIEHAIARSSI